MAAQLSFFSIARGIWPDMKTLRDFREHFGMDYKIVAGVWDRLIERDVLPIGAKPKHLLWLFYWWKCYNTQGVCARFCKCDKGTFLEWRKKMEKAVAQLDNVSSIICIDCMLSLTINHCLF